MKQVDKLTDPAKADKPVLSRGQLEMIEEDPTKIEVVARLMGAVNLDDTPIYVHNALDGRDGALH